MDKESILASIRAILCRYVPPGTTPNTTIPHCLLVHRVANTAGSACMDKPMASLTVSGHKAIQTAGHTFELLPGVVFATCVEMPSTSVILDASEKDPYLSIIIGLDRNILANLLAETADSGEPPTDREPAGAWTEQATRQMLDAFLRLARLLETPEHAPVLGGLIIREIHYLLLTSPHGHVLKALYHSGSGIMDVISWLKHNTAANASMPSLARMARMSISSFHRHFKEITGLSPLQYHKKLRLFEAQRLMLAENQRVNEAALAVGYESVTQFNREYRRMFGEAPARDINKKRNRLA